MCMYTTSLNWLVTCHDNSWHVMTYDSSHAKRVLTYWENHQKCFNLTWWHLVTYHDMSWCWKTIWERQLPILSKHILSIRKGNWILPATSLILSPFLSIPIALDTYIMSPSVSLHIHWNLICTFQSVARMTRICLQLHRQACVTQRQWHQENRPPFWRFSTEICPRWRMGMIGLQECRAFPIKTTHCQIAHQPYSGWWPQKRLLKQPDLPLLNTPWEAKV